MERAFRRKRRITRTIIALIALSPVVMIGMCVQDVCFPHAFDETFELDSEQRERITALMAESRAKAAQRDAAFVQGRSGIGQLVPRPDLGPCSVRLPRNSSRPGRGWQAPSYRLRTVTAAEVPGLQSAYGRSVEAGAAQYESDLDRSWYREDGPEDFMRRVEGFARAPGPVYEVIMVVQERRDPVGGSPTTGFIPGYVRGRAYLYHYDMGRVICAADIHAESSESVEYRTTTIAGGVNLGDPLAAYGALQADLQDQVRRTIARDLRFAAGDPLPAPALPQPNSPDGGVGNTIDTP